MSSSTPMTPIADSDVVAAEIGTVLRVNQFKIWHAGKTVGAGSQSSITDSTVSFYKAFPDTDISVTAQGWAYTSTANSTVRLGLFGLGIQTFTPVFFDFPFQTAFISRSFTANWKYNVPHFITGTLSLHFVLAETGGGGGSSANMPVGFPLNVTVREVIQ